MLLGAVLSACSAKPSPGASGGGSNVTLTIAAVQGVEDTGLKALAPMYKEKTGVTIQIVEAPYDSLYSKLVNSFRAKDSTYDLAMMDDPWMPKFGTDGSLSDLGALGIQQDSDIAQVVWDVGTWPPPRGPVPPSEKDKKAQLLGVTIVGNVEMFMYRKDLTDPPASYDDVLTNAKAQNKANFAGYLVRGKATNPVVADFLPILWSFGGDVFDDNWNVVFDNAQSLAAVKFLVEDLKAVAQADPASTDAGDRDRLMAIGQGYQSSTWPGEINTAVLDPASSKVVGKVGFIPIPKGPSGKGVGMMGNWMLGVPKASKNQQAAADFIKWMLEKGTQKTYAQNGGIPSRTSILKDTSLEAANPYFPVLADALTAPPNWRPRTDQWNAVELILGNHLNAALAGQETAQQVVDKASAEVRTLMQNAHYPTK
ncbi:MAG: extracellular solute-binding protein [Chloroflexota bacterium]|nr:extracellular solute-binding protein [Chloroflexota bacterium]